MHQVPANCQSFDVVVVGARVAGAATAMLLARRGVRVALVDRSRFGADTLSTHALMRAGVLQLHRWGLLDRVRAAGTPPLRRTTLSYHDVVMPIAVKPSNGVDALYQATRDALSLPLIELVDTIASHQWSNTAIGDLLLRLAASMTDEFELLSGLDDDDITPAPEARAA